MRTGDTIVALASGQGRSPRALVRVSGALTGAVLARVLTEPPPRRAGAYAVRLRLPTLYGTPELPCLLIASMGPRSYTGEDTAEVLIPGAPALAQRVLALLLDHRDASGHPGGVRPAGPGEFTARAYFAGRMTLDEAEGVQAMIAARSDAELAAARRLLEGESGAQCRNLAEDLAQALALVEAGIDFVDQEDVAPIAAADLRGRIASLLERIGAMLGPRAAEGDGDAEPLVALVGTPNAGKSTLFNALLGRRRVVVSSEAGTTRDAVVEPMDLTGEPTGGRVMLMDLAGLDEALGSRSAPDEAAQHAAWAAIGRADVLVLCDPTGRFERDGALAKVVAGSRPVIRVRTKADTPRGARVENSLISSPVDPLGADADDAAGAQRLSVCALDGWNLAALRRAVAEVALKNASAPLGARAALPRRRFLLDRARLALEETTDLVRAPEGDAPEARALAAPERVASAMRAALDHLGELTGRISPDDIIGRVFATFCVGK